MKRFSLLILFVLIFPLSILGQTTVEDTTGTAPPIKPAKKKPVNKSAEISIDGILTEEELSFYRSDLFPLSLLQRGRLTTNAYRGMPAGFREIEYGGKILYDPFNGFWNTQWLPYYQSGDRWHTLGSNTDHIAPLAPVTKKPLTRIVFSQDYVINLSFVDISFSRRLNKTDYFRLSGTNYLTDGSQESNFSSTKVNTYRFQYHREWSKRWHMDLFFWHLRQRYRMLPEFSLSQPELSTGVRDKFKLSGNTAWVTLQGKLGEKDSLVIVPAFRSMADLSWSGNDEARKNRYLTVDLDARYYRQFGNSQAGLKIFSNYARNKPTRIWFRRSEVYGKASAFLERQKGDWQYSLAGGYALHNELDGAAHFSASLEKKVQDGFQIGAAAFRKNRPVPMLWRTVIFDSTRAPYWQRNMIAENGMRGILRFGKKSATWLQIEPFFLQSKDYPVLNTGGSLWEWEKTTYENLGVRVQTGFKLWHFRIREDFTFNDKYNSSFAPQINNNLSAMTTFSLFNNAISVDGIINWHYIGDFQTVNYSRLLNYYAPAGAENGRYNLLDGRVQLNFRDATLFFFWENLLSEDYFIINDTLEGLLVFRFGIDWKLYN